MRTPVFVASRAHRVALACLALGAWVGACSEDVPSFPAFERDLGARCDEAAAPCPSGSRCLRGRCALPCEGDADCGARERCEEGVCVEAPVVDAGVDGGVDAGLDPCGRVECPALCRAVGEEAFCVDCIADSREECDDAFLSLCDFARGLCIDPVRDEVCGPCDTDRECEGDVARTCVDLGTERVCLERCDEEGGCPAGFTCEESRCLPRFGTCTGLRLGVAGARCASDAACVPLGVEPSMGVCAGADPVEMIEGRCTIPCGAPLDCPEGLGCLDGRCGPVAGP